MQNAFTSAFPSATAAALAASFGPTVKPVINITRKAPGAKPVKFARVVFPEGSTVADVRATLKHFPEEEGFRCDVRQTGPQGFSLPLDLANEPALI